MYFIHIAGAVLFVAIGWITAPQARAAAIFHGVDSSFSAGRPNSDDARNQFTTAALSVGIRLNRVIDFESLGRVGVFDTSHFVGDNGTTATPTYPGNQITTICSDDTCGDHREGFNTTLGGDQWLQVSANSSCGDCLIGVTFNLAPSTNALGFYYTGMDGSKGAITLSIDEGKLGPVVYSLGRPTCTTSPPDPFLCPGVGFFGFIDTSAPIFGFTVEADSAVVSFGIDDILIDEPGSNIIFCLALIGLGISRVRAVRLMCATVVLHSARLSS